MKRLDMSTILSVRALIILFIAGCSQGHQPGSDADFYKDRGRAYLSKGQYDQAITDYSRAIALQPGLAGAYNNRGIAYFLIKEYDNAWNDVKKAQDRGGQINPEFLKKLREVSGRES
ncbi:tetratricopeptide repeat protein [Thermodesulfobacteriota bacterium]